MRILYIADDDGDARYVRKGLEQAGYLIDASPDGDDALLRLADSDYDAVIADFDTLTESSIQMIERLAEASLGDPLIVVTSKNEPETRVRGLRAGADVLIERPFAFSEFVARLEALLRRRHQRPALEKFQRGPLRLDSALQTASWAEAALPLRRREFLILECLARNADRVVERQEIIDYVWGSDFEPRSNVVDLYVSRLRQKIQSVAGGQVLQTMAGHGYRLMLDANPAEIRKN